MDSDYVKNVNIWVYFRNKFHNSSFNGVYGIENKYKTFIENLDLGITTVSSAHHYRIIDNKKWLLAKIKYGF